MKTLPLLAAFLLASAAFAEDAPAPSPLAPQVLDAKNAATERASDHPQAFARAKATGKDVAVLQYGSDWNPASAALHQNVWNKDAFLKALGPGFVVLAIDQPEVVGGRALYGRCTAEKCGLTGYSDTPVGNAPPLHLETLAKAEPPASDILSVASEGKAVFAKREDGTFVADPQSPNPPQDTLTLALKPAKAGALLRLDFPIDDSLPNGGPGRAGNAVISEIEVAQDGQPVKATHAWGSLNAGGDFSPWTVIDGDASQKDEGWNLQGGKRQRRTLLVALEKPVAAGADLAVKLVCKSQWSRYVPGAVRACVVEEADALADVKKVAEAQLQKYRNRGFPFGGSAKMPRLCVFDAQGRPVGADSTLSIDLSPADLAARIHAIRARREKRDALWTKAQTAEGPAKAEWLRQGLDAMNVGRDPEFGRRNGWGGGAKGFYEPIHQMMREADPGDASGAIRWLGFGQGPGGGIVWRKTVTDAAGAVTQQGNEWSKVLAGKKQPTAADYAAAQACIDRELADPRNKLLEHDHLQHMMKIKYDLYLRQANDDHEDEKVLDIQRAIAKLDPDTFWGVGAVGYLGMHRRTENPFLVYGFNAKHQAKAGKHAWMLADAWKEIDHAGPYIFTARYQGGKEALKITRVTVMIDGRPAGEGTPAPGQETLDAKHGAVVIPFTCTAQIPKGTKALLQVEYEAETDGPLVAGTLAVDPVLVEE